MDTRWCIAEISNYIHIIYVLRGRKEGVGVEILRRFITFYHGISRVYRVSLNGFDFPQLGTRRDYDGIFIDGNGCGINLNNLATVPYEMRGVSIFNCFSRPTVHIYLF